jgi:hypothetical protein
MCDVCAKDPSAHSFKKVGEKRGIVMFYTKPAQATKYKDTEGIKKHVDAMLQQVVSKRWMVIIDGDGFEAKHLAEFQTGHSLTELFFTTYSANLVEVKIINPTIYIQTATKILRATIPDDQSSKITMLDDKPYSVLQFI